MIVALTGPGAGNTIASSSFWQPVSATIINIDM